MIVSRKTTYLDSGDPIETAEVSKIGEIGAKLYPAAGEIHRKRVGGEPSLGYKFDVTNVRELKPSVAREDWFFEWPGGTDRTDSITGDNRRIPFDKDQIAHILANRDAAAAGYFWTWVVLGVNVVGIVLIIAYFVRRRRKAN